jgi:hypothetical protein
MEISVEFSMICSMPQPMATQALALHLFADRPHSQAPSPSQSLQPVAQIVEQPPR